MYASGSPVRTAHALPYLQMQTVSGCHYYFIDAHCFLYICNNKGQAVFLWKE